MKRRRRKVRALLGMNKSGVSHVTRMGLQGRLTQILSAPHVDLVARKQRRLALHVTQVHGLAK